MCQLEGVVLNNMAHRRILRIMFRGRMESHITCLIFAGYLVCALKLGLVGLGNEVANVFHHMGIMGLPTILPRIVEIFYFQIGNNYGQIYHRCLDSIPLRDPIGRWT